MTVNRPAKVFLSSTSYGLKDIRSVAIEAIKAAGCDPVVMEEFGAVPDIPDSVCQEKIDESDFYLGLFGWRYGSRPPRSDQSYTEREYQYAQLRGLPGLIFLLDESVCAAEMSGEPEPALFRARQEELRRTVRQNTTVTIHDLEQLRTEVARALGNALREEAWGTEAVVFGRREFLRDIKRELTTDHRNLALIGLPGSGKSTLALVFRDAPLQGYRVWFDQLLKISAPGARADITGLTTNDLAGLANSALGHAASDKTLPQLIDLLRAQLSDGQPTIIVLDNVWPAHIDSLKPLYARLSSFPNASFLITSRFPEVPGLLAVGSRNIVARPVPALEEQPGLELLTWLVVEQIGKSRRDARPDLNLLHDELKSLARHADGYPAMLEILSGLVVRQGHSIQALRSCAKDIERELAGVREDLERSLGPGEELHASVKFGAELERLLGNWLKPDGLSSTARDLLGLCTILPPMPFSYSQSMLQLHWQAACAASIEGWGASQDQLPELYDPEGPEDAREQALRLQMAGLRAKQLLQDADQPVGRESRCDKIDDTIQERYALHTIAADYFRNRVLGSGARTQLHVAAEEALHGVLEEGPLLNMSGMYAIEGTRWQGRVSLSLYHLAHIARVQPVSARTRMASLYLDAFWWWGYYERFPFCDLLISNWERVVAPPEKDGQGPPQLRSPPARAQRAVPARMA